MPFFPTSTPRIIRSSCLIPAIGGRMDRSRTHWQPSYTYSVSKQRRATHFTMPHVPVLGSCQPNRGSCSCFFHDPFSSPNTKPCFDGNTAVSQSIGLPSRCLLGGARQNVSQCHSSRSSLLIIPASAFCRPKRIYGSTCFPCLVVLSFEPGRFIDSIRVRPSPSSGNRCEVGVAAREYGSNIRCVVS